MDGEYGFDVLISLLPGIEQGVVNRNKCALPIVCMDNIRLKIDVPDHFNNGAGKKGEPLGVVIVAVQPRPFEIVLIIQKVIDHTVVLGLEHPAVLAAPRNRHRKTGQKRHRLPQLLRHRFIERQDHTAAHQTDPQGLGKKNPRHPPAHPRRQRAWLRWSRTTLSSDFLLFMRSGWGIKPPLLC